MATTTEREAKGCTFQWKIENVRHWWWLKKGEKITSPSFVADALEGTKWSLQLYPIEEEEENFIGLYLHREKNCSGPDFIDVSYQLAFLHKDGSILTEKSLSKRFFKNDSWGWPQFEVREKVFLTERESFLPEDFLIVRCALWIRGSKPSKSHHLYATTLVKVKERSFVWNINEPDNLESGIRNKFKDYLIGFDLILNQGVDRLDINMTSFDESIKYISCNISIIDLEERKENCGIKKYFSDDLKNGPLFSMLLLPKMLKVNKTLYFPNDVLTLAFEFVLSIVEHTYHSSIKLENEVVGIEKNKNETVLIDDLEALYNDGNFSDMEIRTLTKTFPAHSLILSARSPVFSSMFSNDMMEKCGYVDITDLEDDTLHRMLLYIYTDSLEELQFESACKLYKIADKYQILSLKSGCSSFLIENLNPTNACGVLDLSVLYHDDNLKSAVQDYILSERKQIFCSQEWSDFMKAHLKLAADIMYKKLTKSKKHLP